MFPSHTLSMSNNYVQLGAQIATIPEPWNSITCKSFMHFALLLQDYKK
jgi:hypothetical protein